MIRAEIKNNKFLEITNLTHFFRTGIPNSHLHRLIIPDDVITQFDLLMMSAVTLETCKDMK